MSRFLIYPAKKPTLISGNVSHPYLFCLAPFNSNSFVLGLGLFLFNAAACLGPVRRERETVHLNGPLSGKDIRAGRRTAARTAPPAAPHRPKTECKISGVVVLTLRESKQAMTRPFSTWQLLAGWANLHSLSGREHVPLWNSRHTSSVSHFVSRI